MNSDPKMHLYGHGELKTVETCVFHWAKDPKSCIEFNADAVNSTCQHLRGLSQLASSSNDSGAGYILTDHFMAVSQAALYDTACDFKDRTLGIEAKRILLGEGGTSCDLSPLVDYLLINIFGRDAEPGN